MRTVGVDLAAQADKTAVCVLAWSTPTMIIERIQLGADDAAIVTAAQSADITGIDAPFGWPDAFVEFVCASRADGDLHPVWSAEQRDRLRFRRTDVVVREVTGR